MFQRSRRLSDQHLERQLCQRPGQNQKQMLALDEILHSAEQCRVELVCAGMSNGSGVLGLGSWSGVSFSRSAQRLHRCYPRRRIEPTTQGCYSRVSAGVPTSLRTQRTLSLVTTR